MPHPSKTVGEARDTKPNDMHPVPPVNPKATEGKGNTQGQYGDGKGIKTDNVTTTDRVSVCKVTNDQAALDFLGGYTGETITEEDYEKAAEVIGCEVAVVKAVAEIEGKKGFDKNSRPVILYERHVFARCTKPAGKYNLSNPDISSKKPYRFATTKEKRKGSTTDFYMHSYARLAKAYALDKAAALKACSWGKFQILGENYSRAGFGTLESYVSAMCQSEKEHLKAFVHFIVSHKLLRKAAVAKDWAKFALYYNGRGYRKFNYDLHIECAYQKYALQNPAALDRAIIPIKKLFRNAN